MTTAGLCRPGDVLGVVDGDILRIGSDLAEVAIETVELMLSAGAELATIVRGVDADDAMLTQVVDRLSSAHPGVEFVTYEGGQPLWPLIFGVE